MTQETGKITLALIAAISGLLGTALGAFLNNKSEITLEGEKLKSQLILHAVSGKSKVEAISSLRFYIEAGIIANEGDFLEKRNQFSGKAITEATKSANISRQAIEVVVQLEKNNFQPGERFKPKVRCSEDCFLRIYHVGQDRRAVLIYPPITILGEETFLRKGEELIAVEMMAVPPFGFDLIVAVASSEPFEDLDFGNPMKVRDFSANELATLGVPETASRTSGFAVEVFSVSPNKALQRTLADSRR